MAFVSDKLYNGYLRRNMAIIVSRVKPMEIMVRLPCLTAHDREAIQAKTETRGNFDGMTCLLDCLKRREQWPEQLIRALEACEHTTIAAEIRAEYNTLMGVGDSSPGARVHPAPSAQPGAGATGAGATGAGATGAGATGARALEGRALEAGALEAVQASVAPHEPALQPPSPETPHREETPHPHQQPEENSESDSEQDVKICHPEVKDQPERSPSPPSPPPSAFSVTPEKLPVQDTTPPLVRVLTEDTSEPSTVQVGGTRPDQSRRDDDDDVCLSKPHRLVSIQPSSPPSPTPPAQPYSGNSDRLDMSAAPAGSALVHRENGAGPGEPEENHYDPPASGVGAQEVLVNVVRVSEEASILNLQGQASSEVARDAALSSPLTSQPSLEITKYIVTAAGVGVCALLVAWRLRN